MNINTIHTVGLIQYTVYTVRLSVISEQMILDIVQGKDIGGVFNAFTLSVCL